MGCKISKQPKTICNNKGVCIFYILQSLCPPPSQVLIFFPLPFLHLTAQPLRESQLHPRLLTTSAVLPQRGPTSHVEYPVGARFMLVSFAKPGTSRIHNLVGLHQRLLLVIARVVEGQLASLASSHPSLYAGEMLYGISRLCSTE